jgi:hypothetical protein
MPTAALRAALLLAIAALGSAADPAPKPPLRDFLGLNGHFTFKPELYRQVCRLARNYHNLSWDVKAIGEPITLPRCVNGVDWTRDVYGRWAAAGIETDLCIMLNGFGPELADYRQRWADHEPWAFAYGKALAEAFGPSHAKLATSFEIGNEPGTGFDADTYRLVFKAMAEGIRAGDAKAVILTAAAKPDARDAYAIDLSRHFAEPELLPLYDAINVHTYAVIPRKDPTECPWTRGFPESAEVDYLQGVDATIAWRDRNAPGKRVWVTEFGYDACTPEAMARRKDWAAKLDWQGVPDLQQAQYLVRSILLLAERDVERAYIYFYDDDDSPSVHGCSGLTRGFKPKPAFWAVKQLSETLGGYRFSRTVTARAGELRVDELAAVDDPTRLAWVAWSPTGMRTDRKAAFVPREAEVTLDHLPGRVEHVIGMATADVAPAATTWTPAGDGTFRLTVGESPTYVLMRR